MDDAEIDRLRKAIYRSYGSSPHKKKYWLALLDMHEEAQLAKRSAEHDQANESNEARAAKGNCRRGA
jgi:hypothetical protein